MGTLIKNGTIITAGDTIRADLLIKGEKISLIGLDVPEDNHKIFDAQDKYLLPGGIDVHTHLELPVSGTVSSDDFYTGTKAAAFGGTTSLIDFAIQPKGGTLKDGLALWHEKASGQACIDYSFHANVTDPDELLFQEIPELPALGITSVKVLMAYKGTFQVDDTALYRVMEAAKEQGILVMVHCENGDVIAQLIKHILSRGNTAPHYHLEAHPEAAETEATCRAASIAGITGATTYIVHVTCAGAAEQLAIARAKGYPVMGETCVQYLALDQDALLPLENDKFEGAKYVCSPPLRTVDDADVLLDTLASDILQAVSTDHCPFYYQGGQNGRPGGKELGRKDFTKIPNGLPGIEDRLIVSWHIAVNSGRITPNRFVAVMSTNPARIFGMYPRKGTLSPGSDADIVIWDPEQVGTISAKYHHMNTDYNAYEGLKVRGWPTRVFLRGKMIVDGGIWHGDRGAGHFISRSLGEFI
jgi:dihydropyrimidinase